MGCTSCQRVAERSNRSRRSLEVSPVWTGASLLICMCGFGPHCFHNNRAKLSGEHFSYKEAGQSSTLWTRTVVEADVVLPQVVDLVIAGASPGGHPIDAVQSGLTCLSYARSSWFNLSAPRLHQTFSYQGSETASTSGS
jgi:hypothetical protein